MCNGVMTCNRAIACHGEMAVSCNSATASLPETETTVTMLYRGIDGAIGGVVGIDTDCDDVIW